MRVVYQCSGLLVLVLLGRVQSQGSELMTLCSELSIVSIDLSSSFDCYFVDYNA